MTLVWSPGFNYDTNASAYIDAVEVADGQALETATRYAINDFVIGCKNDGIWNAIKASCILAGARTLAGALVPLVGTAPTNFNFVSGDYNRETGLTGNASNKALRTGLLGNALSNTSHHMFFSGSGFETTGVPIVGRVAGGFLQTSPLSILTLVDLIAIGDNSVSPQSRYARSGTGDGASTSAGLTSSGTLTLSRTSSTSLTLYQNGSSAATDTTSTTPSLPAIGFGIFGRNDSGTITNHTGCTMNFFSVGDGLSGGQTSSLHARVTSLINAFAAAIP